MDDGSGSVRVDDYIYDEFMPVLGNTYQLTGILYFSYGEFKILPRDENDIAEILSTGDNNIPESFVLHPAYPNPFNPITMIRFTVGTLRATSLHIFDINGRMVDTLVDGMVESGDHEIRWDAENFSSGIYFIHLRVGDKSRSQKVIYLK